MFIDSMIMARVMQGRWKAKQAWLTRLCVHANDFMYTMGSVSGDHHEYWWISHVTRWHNTFADAMSKYAREVALPLTLLIFDTALWESWLAQGSVMNGKWCLSLDGSTLPCDGYSKGTSGVAAILWHVHVGSRSLVACCTFVVLVGDSSLG